MFNRKITKVREFSSGKRSLVYTGLYKSKKIAIKKVKYPRIHKNLIKNEVSFLKILNKHKIGPKLVLLGKGYFVMEFVEGQLFSKIVNKANSKNLIKKVLLQCYKLDKLKINKLEFTRPIKHVIIRKNNPVIIDFERCYYTNNPKNVTQFCQYLIKKDLVSKDKREFIEVIKKYKINKSEKNFKSILNSL